MSIPLLASNRTIVSANLVGNDPLFGDLQITQTFDIDPNIVPNIDPAGVRITIGGPGFDNNVANDAGDQEHFQALLFSDIKS